MILVDTSVWINHFHGSEPHLVDLLGSDEVCSHPIVIEELALGSITQREETLELLGNLQSLPILSHEELLIFVRANRLWGRGLSPTDAHLLGSTRLGGSATLWTRDRRLHAAAVELGVAHSA